MSRLILALAAIAAAGLAAASPAASTRHSASVTVHRGFSGRFDPNVRTAQRDRRGNFGDQSVYLDRDYQGDTAWRPDSFNDWWHDRPERSMPRWLGSNECARQYWTGGGWRC